MCEVSVAATERCLPVVRASVRRWLAGLGWPEDPAEDIVLAVHEAVSNAIEHAYPPDGIGVITVEGVLVADPPDAAWDAAPAGAFPHGGRRVQVLVRDDGRWRPDQHDRSDCSRPRGRGLTMMAALMPEMTITASGETGTQVELISEPVSH